MIGQISNLGQIAYARKYTLTGGHEDGIKVIEVNNGVLRFMLNESKNLDVMELWHKGTNMSFISKNGFTAREIPFLNRFEGGMLYTCGLDSAGGREGFELHGRLHNCPSDVKSIEVNENEITIIGETLFSALFGENLVLRRKIHTKVNSDTLSITDTLINNGTKTENYVLLYHVNLGYPMLDEGVKIYSDIKEIIPRNDWAKQRMKGREIFTAPVDNEDERCYFIKHTTPVVKVENKKLGKTFELNYSDKTLPCMVQWNSSASGDYALGIEPCTTYLDDYFEYKKIKPKEKIEFCVSFKITD